MRILKIFEEKLRYKNYSKKTIKLYTNYLSIFLLEEKIKDPYQLTTNRVIKYLENKKYKSISQQNLYIGCLKLFCKFILNKKNIHLSKIERPKSEKKIPQVIDNQHILDNLSKITNLKHKTILTLTYSVGLRVSEVVNLKIVDIDSKRMLITIKNGKGKKDRIVPLSEKVLILLRNYYRQFKPTIYLFNGIKPGEPYSIGSCQRIYKKYIDKKTSIHCLRHSSFTNLLENDTDLRIIQSIAGHSSSKTTEIYTHVSTKLLKKVKLPV